MALLIYTAMVSAKHPMWLDEIYTYYGVAHGSFGDFYRSYLTNINAAPPLYFLLTWTLTKLIPLSVHSLPT